MRHSVDARSIANCPLVHAVHSEALRPLKVPGLQAVQTVAAVADTKPDGHSLHEEYLI